MSNKNLDRFLKFANKNVRVPIRNSRDVVIYTRVSSRDQMENGASLDTQMKYCKEFARRKELNVVAFFGGTYESAKSDDRKEFQRMINYVKRSKNVAAIIVYSYDRFSRSGNNGAMISEDLQKKYGVSTLSVTQEVNPENATGAFQRDMFYLFGKFDNTQRTEKSITGMREKIREGHWVWAIPIGYKNLNKGQTADKHELIITEQGELLRQAFHWKAERDMPTVDIAKRLTNQGLKMTDKKLSKIFQNPFYCGVLTSRLLPGEVYRGKHIPLITEELFWKINDPDHNHPRKKGYKVQLHNDRLPLKVFTKCDDCGAPMTGYLVKKKGLYYYKCRTKGCSKNRNADVVKQGFESLLSSFQLDRRYQDILAAQMKKLFFKLNEDKLQELKAYKANLTEVTGRLETIEERFAIGEIDRPIFEKYHLKYQGEKLEIEGMLENASISSSNLEQCVEYTVNLSGNLLKMWREADILGKQNIKSLVFPEGVRYNREKDEVRTERVNIYFSVIPTLSAHYREEKEKGKYSKNTFPHLVESEGFEPSSREGKYAPSTCLVHTFKSH